MLTIRMLGELAVLRNGEPLSLPPSKKTRALLAYLVATGRPQRRERLCTLFWEVPDDPRGALRWSLSKLRALVNEPDGTPRILADRETVAFVLADAACDLLTLRDLVARPLDTGPTERLQAVAEGIGGAFLEGLDLPAQPDFQAWCVAEREDARRQHAAVLSALVTRFSPGPPEAALAHARRLVELRAFDARARAALIRLLARIGRRQEAEQHGEAGLRLLGEAGLPAGDLATAVRDVRAVLRRTEAPLPDGTAAAVQETRPGPSLPELVPAERKQVTVLVPHQEIRFCVAEDGVRIAYATVGEGPPLVKPANWMTHLEHDWQSPVWRHWMRELSRDHRLIRYDERGNRLSDWQVEDLSFEACLRDLEAVIDAAGLERFPMLGVSQGCASSVTYAVRHPDRVSNLVLFGGYARGWGMRGKPDEIARRNALATLIRLGWGENNSAFRQAFTTMFVPDATLEQMQWFNKLQHVTASPENAARLHEMFGTIQIEALLPRVRVPTLVLHSRDEGVVPFEEGRILATAIPGARFVPLESRNHILLEDEPAWGRFLAEVRAFLGTNNP